jgi:hypothetical protein
MFSRLISFLFIFPLITVSASQLDVAVVQFPEPKSADEINTALSHVSLAEMTGSDKTVTNIPALQGGRVLFAQSLPSSAVFQSRCRLSDIQGSMEGRYSNDFLSLKITLSEGFNAVLRRLTSHVFEGSGKLSIGQARVIGIRNIEVKKKTASKGNLSVQDDFTCNVILAQIR